MQAQGLAEIAMNDAPKVVTILRCEGLVETVGVPEGGDVGGGRTLAEHLHDRIAGDQMNQQEDDRDHQPKDRQRDRDAPQRGPESLQSHRRGSVVARGFAGRFVCTFGSSAATTGSVSTRTRLMRLPRISATM